MFPWTCASCVDYSLLGCTTTIDEYVFTILSITIVQPRRALRSEGAWRRRLQVARGGASGVRSKRWQTFFPAKRTNCEAMSISETQYAFVHCETASTVCRNRTPTSAFTAALSSDSGLVSNNAKLMRRLIFQIHDQLLGIVTAEQCFKAEHIPFESCRRSRQYVYRYHWWSPNFFDPILSLPGWADASHSRSERVGDVHPCFMC